jgi:hypothetical protein
MDWETAMECWLALVDEDPYAPEALELLAEEFSRYGNLRMEDRFVLDQLVEKIRCTGQYGGSEAVEGIFKVLRTYDGFQKQITRVVLERVQGTR